MKHFLLFLVIICGITKVRTFADTVCFVPSQNLVESSCIDHAQSIFYRKCLHQIWDTTSSCFFTSFGKLHQISNFTMLKSEKLRQLYKIQVFLSGCDKWYSLVEENSYFKSNFLRRNVYVVLMANFSIAKIFDGTFNDGVITNAIQQKICRNSSEEVVTYCDVLPNSMSNWAEVFLYYLNLAFLILSIPGLCGIGLTAIIFKEWRKNTKNQILLYFGIALAAKHFSSFCFEQALDVPALNGLACYTFGVLYHYFQLAHFSWMFFLGIHQFKRLVIVFGELENLLLKACLLGWLTPAIPVVLLLICDYKNYEELCIPRDYGLIFALWLPAAAFTLCNAIIFLCIFYTLLFKRPEILQSQASDNRASKYLRHAILLTFMLGINWVFVLGDILFPENFFFRFFAVTTSLQGFVLFLFFIVLTEETRNMYFHLFRKWFRCFRWHQTETYVVSLTVNE